MSVEMIHKGFDSIESKINQAYDSLNTEQRVLADRVMQLEQRGSAMPMGNGDMGRSETLGARVLKGLRENADLLAKTKNVRLTFEAKAAADVITTASGRTIQSGGVGKLVSMSYGIQNAFSVTPTPGVSAIEYFRYSGTEGAAGVQAGEGATKAAVRPTHTQVTQTALTIAGYTKVSRQAMNDSAELMQAIDVTLNREIAKALDAALMVGNVTPAFDGLLTLATAHTSLNYSYLWDAASEGVATMLEAGLMPDVVTMSPADWLGVQTARNPTTGDYFSWQYLNPLPEYMRGLRVVVSPNMTAGKLMLLDSKQIDLRINDAFNVEVNYVNDDFIKNQATVLAEMSVIPVFRAVGAARLITPKVA